MGGGNPCQPRDQMTGERSQCGEDAAALVDEAFVRLQKGDVGGAEESCRHAEAHAADPAQIRTLAGCIATERGDFDQAYREFQGAIALAPERPVPWIDLAELQLEMLDDPRGCLETCEHALSLTEGDAEARVELLTFQARAWIALECEDEALDALRATQGLEVADPDALEAVGAAAHFLGAWDIAEKAYSAALRVAPFHADAHHGLGFVCIEQGKLAEAGDHWRQTLDSDRQVPRPAWHMGLDAFEIAIEHALLELPESARTLLRPVPIVVEDIPSEEEVVGGLDPRVLGIFCGPAMHERSTLDAGPSEPVVIKIYQRNLEAICENEQQLLDEIRTTLLHETAHYFGLEDDDLSEIGLS